MLPTAFTALAVAATITVANGLSNRAPLSQPKCLRYDEAWDISTRWLSIFSTNGVTSKEQLGTIVASDLYSVDDTFGPPTTTLEQLWEDISAGGETTTTDVQQFPLFLFNSCDQIAVRWQYTGVATGYNSTVKDGTEVGFQGNDILTIDLNSRLIINATSSGDWILLAEQLGRSCSV